MLMVGFSRRKASDMLLCVLAITVIRAVVASPSDDEEREARASRQQETNAGALPSSPDRADLNVQLAFAKESVPALRRVFELLDAIRADMNVNYDVSILRGSWTRESPDPTSDGKEQTTRPDETTPIVSLLCAVGHAMGAFVECMSGVDSTLAHTSHDSRKQAVNYVKTLVDDILPQLLDHLVTQHKNNLHLRLAEFMRAGILDPADGMQLQEALTMDNYQHCRWELGDGKISDIKDEIDQLQSRIIESTTWVAGRQKVLCDMAVKLKYAVRTDGTEAAGTSTCCTHNVPTSGTALWYSLFRRLGMYDRFLERANNIMKSLAATLEGDYLPSSYSHLYQKIVGHLHYVLWHQEWSCREREAVERSLLIMEPDLHRLGSAELCGTCRGMLRGVLERHSSCFNTDVEVEDTNTSDQMAAVYIGVELNKLSVFLQRIESWLESLKPKSSDPAMKGSADYREAWNMADSVIAHIHKHYADCEVLERQISQLVAADANSRDGDHRADAQGSLSSNSTRLRTLLFEFHNPLMAVRMLFVDLCEYMWILKLTQPNLSIPEIMYSRLSDVIQFVLRSFGVDDDVSTNLDGSADGANESPGNAPPSSSNVDADCQLSQRLRRPWAPMPTVCRSGLGQHERMMFEDLYMRINDINRRNDLLAENSIFALLFDHIKTLRRALLSAAGNRTV